MIWLIYLFTIISPNTAEICNRTFHGSTVEYGYQDFNIDLVDVAAIANGSIQFNTCSEETTFDTFLHLYNRDETSLIDSCDDHCSDEALSCMNTIWDLYLSDLTDSYYILKLDGSNGESGTFELIVTYDCTYNVLITTTDECDTDYPCPFRVINTDVYATIFYFNISEIDNILQNHKWDSQNFDIYNLRTQQITNCLFFRNNGIGGANCDNIHFGDFETNDLIAFSDTTVYCHDKLCTYEATHVNVINVIAVIVVLVILYCGCMIMCISALVRVDSTRNWSSDGGYGLCAMAENNPKTGQFLEGFLQSIIFVSSIISSSALSNKFGMSAFDNGMLAVTMGVINFMLNYCKCQCGWGIAMTKPYENDSDSGFFFDVTKNESMQAWFLTMNIFFATLSDAAFDILQGIAVINGQEYRGLYTTILLTATWAGVVEEVIGIIVVGLGKCSNIHVYVTVVLVYLINIVCMAELCMGIVLFSAFISDDSIFLYGCILQGCLLFPPFYFFYVMTYYVVVECVCPRSPPNFYGDN